MIKIYSAILFRICTRRVFLFANIKMSVNDLSLVLLLFVTGSPVANITFAEEY